MCLNKSGYPEVVFACRKPGTAKAGIQLSRVICRVGLVVSHYSRTISTVCVMHQDGLKLLKNTRKWDQYFGKRSLTHQIHFQYSSSEQSLWLHTWMLQHRCLQLATLGLSWEHQHFTLMEIHDSPMLSSKEQDRSSAVLLLFLSCYQKRPRFCSGSGFTPEQFCSWVLFPFKHAWKIKTQLFSLHLHQDLSRLQSLRGFKLPVLSFNHKD